MSDPTDQIQALLAQVDKALHQLSPPIPWLVWGKGIVQSRQVLQQVRDYLLTSQQYPASTESDLGENVNSEGSELSLQRLSHLQLEVQTLRQKRHRLMAEIQQLQTQKQSVIADYSPSSGHGIVSDLSADFADKPKQTNAESFQNLNLSAALSQSEPLVNPQANSPVDVDEDWSDIFGELFLNEIPSSDHAVHLESSEPSLDGQEYVLASPHENLLPLDQDNDQVDSLLLVGRGTLQCLETELMSLEQSLEEEDDSFQLESERFSENDQSSEEVLSFEQLCAQFELNLPQSSPSLASTPLKLGELLEKSNLARVPSNNHQEAESLSLEALSQEFSESSPQKKAKKPLI